MVESVVIPNDDETEDLGGKTKEKQLKLSDAIYVYYSATDNTKLISHAWSIS